MDVKKQLEKGLKSLTDTRKDYIRSVILHLKCTQDESALHLDLLAADDCISEAIKILDTKIL